MKTVKIFGRGNVTSPPVDDEENSLVTLDEICISAEPDKLRAIAKFINDCADKIDKGVKDGEISGEDNWHEHMNDYAETPEIIISY